MKSKFGILAFLFALLAISSCVKDDFDAPPSGTYIPADVESKLISLDELWPFYQVGKPYQFTQDKYLKTYVVGNDISGNIYQTIYLQDSMSSRAIAVNIDDSDLFNKYPVGRVVYVHVLDLWLSDYNELPSIGYDAGGENIPNGVYKNKVFAAPRVIEVTPEVKTISSLNDKDLNKLVQLENIEFETINVVMAPPATTVNHNLVDCDGNILVLRNSGYSNFATDTVPSGNGTLIGIYTKYRTTKQFLVREASDIQFEGKRCGSNATGNETKISVSDLRTQFANGTTTVGEYYIEGVVISDVNTESIVTKNAVVQDGTSGITVRFNSDHNISLGSKVKIIVTNATLEEYNGLLQCSNVEPAEVEVLGAGTVSPAKVSINDLLNNIETYESTLVKLVDVTITGGATYNGTLTVSDGTHNIDLYTRSASTFSSSPVPAGTVTVTAIASQYNDAQLIIRGTNDVEGGSTGEGDELTIRSLRNAFLNGSTSVSSVGYIIGTVTSDYTSGNITTRNLHIQDADAGILVRFTSDHSFAEGTELKIRVTGMELSDYNGLLQLNNVPNSNATVEGSSTVTPIDLTISEIKANLETYESMLVRIKDATFNSGDTFTGTINFSDATGSIPTYVRSQANFSGQATPTGTHNVTCIVSEFNEAQVVLRNLNDID